MFRFHDVFELMGALMPVLAVIGFFVVVIIRTVMGGRQRELEIKARIAAMENNVPVEPLPPSRPNRPGSVMMPLGIIFVCTGVGLAVALAFAGANNEAVWGIMPISAGAGLIIADRMNRPEPNPANDYRGITQPERTD